MQHARNQQACLSLISIGHVLIQIDYLYKQSKDVCETSNTLPGYS
jgi:hypothetical protein